MNSNYHIVEREKVLCPVCNRGRLGDKNKFDEWKIEAYDAEYIPPNIKPTYYEKCHVCKRTIAMVFKKSEHKLYAS